MCTTLGELPYIRYARSPVATTLAAATQDALDDLSADDKALLKRGDNRPTLLILDRTIDTVAPVLHEFTYQGASATTSVGHAFLHIPKRLPCLPPTTVFPTTQR